MEGALARFRTSVEKFGKSVGDFPVGAISIENFEPLPIQIEKLRDSVKQLDRRVAVSNTKLQSQTNEEATKKDDVEIVKKLQESTMQTILSDEFTKLCLHSKTINKVLSDVDRDDVLNDHISKCMYRLYSLNDETIALQEKLTDAYQQQLQLKIECRQAMSKHRAFLEEQAEIREKTKESKSVASPTKKARKKMQKILTKVNIMKRLITSLVATSETKLTENPILVDMLARHRKLLTMDQLSKLRVDATDET